MRSIGSRRTASSGLAKLSTKTEIMKKIKRAWQKPLLAVLAGMALAIPQSGLAATLTVVNLNDDGPGSLRGTIDASAAGDTIIFAPGLSGTITVAGPEP